MGNHGFSLIEAFLIFLILWIAVALLMPVYESAYYHRIVAGCQVNLKEIGWAYRSWGDDHGGKFPMEISQANGGTKESAASGNAVTSFQIISNELKSPRFLICPADRGRRAAANFSTGLTGANISYFVDVDVRTNDSWMYLAGDDNLAFEGVPVKSGLLILTTNELSDWRTVRMEYIGLRHIKFGNLVYADGHLGQEHDGYFGSYLDRMTTATNRLAIP